LIVLEPHFVDPSPFPHIELTESGIVLLTVTVFGVVSPTNLEMEFVETRVAVGAVVKEAGSNEVMVQSQSDNTPTPHNLNSIPAVCFSMMI
jgi:hypothetical protein